MAVLVFLSYSMPVVPKQRRFIESLRQYLLDRGLQPRTLGITDYDVDSPLVAIHRLLKETNGLLSVGFRRHQVAQRPIVHGDVSDESWTTSPYCHIEAAMAFQLGLPVMVTSEAGVIRDGALRDGVIGPHVGTFDLRRPIDRYLQSAGWRQAASKWEHQVRTVFDRKGHPDRWYD